MMDMQEEYRNAFIRHADEAKERPKSIAQMARERRERERRKERIKNIILIPFQIIFALWLIGSMVAIPVGGILWVWDVIDLRWVATLAINGAVALIFIVLITAS